MLFDIKRELFSLQLSEKTISGSKHASPSRLSINYRNIAFGLVEAVTCVAGLARSFGCNERTIYRL